MAIENFKFLSPGVYINEIDQSELPKSELGVGPVVIGRSLKGPMMRPVIVQSVEEFQSIFGEPLDGLTAVDVSRPEASQSSILGPTYGAYAAVAYLRNGGPVTFIRLGGYQSPTASDEGKAGWAADKAYGLFLGTTEKKDNPALGSAETVKDLNKIIVTKGSGDFTQAEVDALVNNKLTVGTGAQAISTTVTAATWKAHTLNTPVQLAKVVLYSNGDIYLHKAVGQAWTPTELTGKAVKLIKGDGTSLLTAAYGLIDTFTIDQNAQEQAVVTLKNGVVLATTPGSTTTYLPSQMSVIDISTPVESPAKAILTLTHAPTVYAASTTASTYEEKLTGELKLGAILYSKGTSPSIGLSGAGLDGVAKSAAVGEFVKAKNYSLANQELEFSLAASATGTKTETRIIRFDKAESKKYIRTALNTSPVLTNGDITKEANKKSYWLAQSFENSILEWQPSAADNKGVVAVMLELGTATDTAANFKKAAEKSSTGWFVGQSKDGSAFDTAGDLADVQVQNLFRFHTLSEDEWVQNNLKVTIENITPSDDAFNEYGTFSVIIESIFGTQQRTIMERFDGLNLNPKSDNFIAKKIGDAYLVWNSEAKIFEQINSNPNASKYIRVEVDDSVMEGTADADLLPHGFYGPKTLKSVSLAAGSAGSVSLVTATDSSYKTALTMPLAYEAIKLSVPALPLVKEAKSADLSETLWGMQTVVDEVNNLEEVVDHLKAYSPVLSSKLEDACLFSIDDITYDPTTKKLTWEPGSFHGGHGAAADSTEVDISDFKFSCPLYGGFDGLNILEKEPLLDSAKLEGKTEDDSAAFATISMALDMVADPEVIPMDLLAVPGLVEKKLARKMLQTAQKRGDTLAILDTAGDFVPLTVSKNTVQEAKAAMSVKEAVKYVKTTVGLNTSYGAAYYPWVVGRDINGGGDIYLPPSVVILGTLSSTKKNSALWFAPAGFNRGGLGDSKISGLNISGVARNLNLAERDMLYAGNVNPIANFAGEGIVVFGQKTLQFTPSALDRVNVRRLLNYVKTEVTSISRNILFEPNVEQTWNNFKGAVEPLLVSIKSRYGLDDFQVVLDDSTTTADLIDRNILYAKVLLKPTRAIEFIAVDFTLTRSGASFGA